MCNFLEIRYSRFISGLEYDDYYYYDYYYDDEEDVYDRVEDRVDTNSEFSEASILDNVLDIVLNRKKNKPRPNVIFQRPGLSQRPRLPPLVPDRVKAFQEDIQEKSDGIFSNLAENISGAIGRLVSSVGFFGILLPGILAGLLYLGVPVAQSMFAGASLITTFLLSTEARESLLSPVSLDAAARFILINVLKILQGLSDGKVTNNNSDMRHNVDDEIKSWVIAFVSQPRPKLSRHLKCKL